VKETGEKGVEPLPFGFGNHCSTTELSSYYKKKTVTKAFLEIKNRIILLSITLLSIFLTVYHYKLFMLILVIISNAALSNELLEYFIFTSITELFLIHVALSLSIAKQLAYFVGIYHLICFLAPGLYRTEFSYLKHLFLIGLLLTILCWNFFNKILVPLVSLFFLSFQDKTTAGINFYFEAKIYEYLKFITEIYFNCFISFQLCVFLILFTNYISNNIKLLKIIRKFFYVLILVLSTLTTPPDVFSQMFLFWVLLIGFETLIFLNILKKNLKLLARQETKAD
jgi:sec-independent protein translocase protein TatC